MAEFLARKSELLGCAPGGCRTVLFGGSYGGMLSAWHRLKYPQLTVGAIAASAPVDLWPGEGRAAQFRNVTLGAFGAYGAPACASTLDRALRRLPALAATAPGRRTLDRTLAPCAPLESAGDGGRLVLYFGGALATTAMLDYPYPQSFVAPLPANPVKVACGRVGGGGDDDALLRGLAAAADVLLDSTGLALPQRQPRADGRRARAERAARRRRARRRLGARVELAGVHRARARARHLRRPRLLGRARRRGRGAAGGVPSAVWRRPRLAAGVAAGELGRRGGAGARAHERRLLRRRQGPVADRRRPRQRVGVRRRQRAPRADEGRRAPPGPALRRPARPAERGGGEGGGAEGDRGVARR